MSVDVKNWARDVFRHLLAQIEDGSQPIATGTHPFDPLTRELTPPADLLQCGEDSVAKLLDAAEAILRTPNGREVACAQLDDLIQLAYKEMARAFQKAAPLCWRRMYTDVCILRTLADLVDRESPKTNAVLRAGIGRLDRAIVIAGPCGDGRLELIQDLIAEIQADVTPADASQELPPSPATRQIALPRTFAGPVSRLEAPPSFSAFTSRLCSQPFVLPGFIRDWPALTDHPWRSLAYLRKVFGPGRVVPIEVGSDYRSDDWTQKMMEMDEFLDALSGFAHGNPKRSPILYLAQHSIFLQFPALRDDIILPDYLYSSPPPQDNYPQYQPPRTEEQLVMNAWLGPAGTVSPAHTVGILNERCPD